MIINSLQADFSGDVDFDVIRYNMKKLVERALEVRSTNRTESTTKKWG